MHENPMIRPLSNEEELQMLSEDDIAELPRCSYCGEPVLGKYRKTSIHPKCWHEGKAEYDISRGKDGE